MKLFTPYKLGQIELKNRVVMAPMTRSRSINNVPGDLVATYYGQRSSAGLIITEGTSPSANGLGYARIPGLYNDEQLAGWKKVAETVHANGAKIFMQLMHTGRVSHSLNMPKGAQILAPSAIRLSGQMYTDQSGLQEYATPKAMNEEEIQKTIAEYVRASELAIKAGLDGVELHAANGYLLEQFLNPKANQRQDQWGGSAENRRRFVLEVAKQTVQKIGAGRVGIRLSPYGVFNDMGPFSGVDEFYADLAKELGALELAYIHVVDHSAMGAPAVPAQIKQLIRDNFKGTYILSGGYDLERAEADLVENKGDLVAFGRPFISNPDLAEKLKNKIPLTPPDQTTLYTPGEKGYTDYLATES